MKILQIFKKSLPPVLFKQRVKKTFYLVCRAARCHNEGVFLLVSRVSLTPNGHGSQNVRIRAHVRSKQRDAKEYLMLTNSCETKLSFCPPPIHNATITGA